MNTVVASFKPFGADLFAYCLMPNHFHLLIGTSQAPIGLPMHGLLTRYSIYFNRRNARVGHLFQDRFKAFDCHDRDYLFNLALYIHRNPVRARIAADLAAWPWSSHGELSSGRVRYTDLRRLEELSGVPPEELKAAYLTRLSNDPSQPGDGLSLHELRRRAAVSAGLHPKALESRERSRWHTEARRRLIQWAVAAGHSLTDVAHELGCSKAAVSQLAKEVKLRVCPLT